MNSLLQRCALVLLLSLQTAVHAGDRVNFDRDWRFHRGDSEGPVATLAYTQLRSWLLPSANAFLNAARHERPAGPAPGEGIPFTQSACDDSGWRTVNLPHDWGIEGPFQQDLPGETAKLPWSGVAWYRKSFDLPAAAKGQHVELEVEGAMSYAAVWCNGRFVGGWPYGYASWQLDLTPYVRPGEKNTLAIRLDNPPDSSRWYPGGGLYRDVWLTTSAPVHVAPWGTSITTPQVGPQSATVEIRTEVVNDSAAPAEVRSTCRIFAAGADGQPTGPALATDSAPSSLTLAPGERKSVRQSLPLPAPRLWSPEQPALYVVRTELEQGGAVIDRGETPFGVRTIEFTVDDGFHLNGHRVPLHGVCLHHDLGALGAAFYPRAAQRQLEILREMGVNAIRTAHNPPAPGLLDLCDRLGFLVLDEFSDTWTIAKKPNGYARLFRDWAEADLRAMIRRDRHHPSIILWSIGNEVGEQGRKPEVAAMLTAIAREEDPTRLTTAGCDQPRAGSNGFQKGVGVFGYNYKPHLYEQFRRDNPNQPLYGSETASTLSSRGEYLFPVTSEKSGGLIGFQMSSYDLYAPKWAQPAEWEFAAQEKFPYVAGEFVWTGFDYLGEPTPFNNDLTILTNYHSPEERARAEAELKAVGKLQPPSRSSYFGIVDLAGFKKDRFYLYQARWRPELPMAHLLPHWSWPERTGEVTPVHLYTSGDEAELFLNGRSLGRRKPKPGETRLRWDEVQYEPGELRAVAYKGGQPWAEDVVRTAGPAVRIALTVDRSTIGADGRDLAFVTATLLDQAGNFSPRAADALRFTVEGAGEIVATDNGDATDHTTFSSPERKAFHGLALAIVRAKSGGGEMTVQVSGPGLQPATVKVQSTPARP